VPGNSIGNAMNDQPEPEQIAVKAIERCKSANL